MSANPESFVDQLDMPESESNESVPEQKSDPAPSLDTSKGDSNGAPKPADVSETKDKLDPAKADQVEKVVPLRALQEERENVKELKRQIQELQAQPKLTDEDRALLASLKQQKKDAEAPKPVDFMEDPKGYVDTKVQAALDKLSEVDKKAETVNSTVTAQQQQQALLGAITSYETAFTKDNADYYQALEHIRGARKAQIRLMYPNATEQQLSNAINQEEMNAARIMIQNGQDPCQFAYKYAETLGYKKAEAKTDPKADKTPKAPVDKSDARTLGSGGSESDSEEDDGDPNNELKSILKSFRKR